jgi:Flp pilus assembly protein TadD
MPEKGNAVELTPREAIEEYERAIKNDPHDADKAMELGAAYYIAHQWDQAREAFENAVALDPNLGHAHYYLGILYAAKGDKERALEELNEVLSHSKNPILIAQAKARIPAVTSTAELATGS